MKKSLIVFGLLLLAAGSALAQQTPSAKFAAVWTEEPALASIANITDSIVDDVVLDSKQGYTLATIKVPQDKELMIGVSAEIGIVTDTSIKGKNGGTATATAGGEAFVTVFAIPQGGGDEIVAKPGQIMLSKRVQALSATLGGVIQSCEVNCSIVNGAVSCEPINIAEDCTVSNEQIGLLQETTAAHHFNFVLPDLKQGVYDIKAFFTTGARAQVDVCTSVAECALYQPTGYYVSASANAAAVINKTMLTVQDVRAVKNSLQESTIIEVE